MAQSLAIFFMTFLIFEFVVVPIKLKYLPFVLNFLFIMTKLNKIFSNTERVSRIF